MLTGSFQFNGGNDPIALLGDPFTAARFDIGLYGIAYRDRYAGLHAGSVTLQLAAAANQLGFMVQASFVSTTIAGHPTLFFVNVTNAAGARVDVAADPNNRLNFLFTVKNTAR